MLTGDAPDGRSGSGIKGDGAKRGDDLQLPFSNPLGRDGVKDEKLPFGEPDCPITVSGLGDTGLDTPNETPPDSARPPGLLGINPGDVGLDLLWSGLRRNPGESGRGLLGLMMISNAEGLEAYCAPAAGDVGRDLTPSATPPEVAVSGPALSPVPERSSPVVGEGDLSAFASARGWGVFARKKDRPALPPTVVSVLSVTVISGDSPVPLEEAPFIDKREDPGARTTGVGGMIPPKDG